MSLLHRWRGTLAYDGTPYQGWQLQPDGRPTVQGELERVLRILAQHPVRTVGASRTDTGVHALGQVVSVATTRERDPGWWVQRLNRLLPPAIRVWTWDRAEWRFQARFDAVGKTYTYDVAWGPENPLVAGLQPWRLREAPDLAALAACLRAYRGPSDWASFTSEHDPPPARLSGVWLVRGPEQCRIIVQGPRFGYQQVRRMVAAALGVARGQLEARAFERLLSEPRWNAQAVVAPAAGLVLAGVHYESGELGSIPGTGLIGLGIDPRRVKVDAL